MKLAALLPILLTQFTLMLAAQSDVTGDPTAAKIEALPKEDREVTIRNAASFTKNDWDNFLKDLAHNYMLGPDGEIFVINEPNAEHVPSIPDSDRYRRYVSWTMDPVPSARYTWINGTVTAVTRKGIVIVNNATPIQSTATPAKNYAEGDHFEAWCERGDPYAYVDEEGESRTIRCYKPADAKKPGLIDVSNYLVKGGRIYGLAPFRLKMCPVCKGFRKYSPNPEIPSETVPCTTCHQTGKIEIHPLYMVYTGSAN